MKAVDIIARCAEETGYVTESIRRRYAFADVLAETSLTRHAALAAFTQSPPSYRSAALAVVENDPRDPHEVVTDYRSLGAPLLFVVDNEDVSLWQVRPDKSPRLLETLTADAIPALFERNRKHWEPEAIHRAKSIGAFDDISVQLDFVDAGLMSAIEGEIHVKLDRLLSETMEAADTAAGGTKINERLLFQTVFRLLAAKVLQDREHHFAKKWDSSNLLSVLSGIEKFYNLGAVSLPPRGAAADAFGAAWEKLCGGINFSNMTSDDLAFVYENTLVTPETRRHFGTHSTPRQVAEYVVRGLELWRHDPTTLHVYEPFAGAGMFLASALRHIKDTLPVGWSDKKRHEFLLNHISGDEKDPFACEVATLSMILADYPNHNGWHIKETDLFVEDTLDQRMAGNNVILCNPPFESFTQAEREQYGLPSEIYSKPMFALTKALDARPIALGFILPRPLIFGKQYAGLRTRIEKAYKTVEIIELPDRIFGASVVESAAIIARDPQPTDAVASHHISLTATTVADRDRLNFLKTGAPTDQRRAKHLVENNPAGNLWVPQLNNLWDYLATYPLLGKKLRATRGVEWIYPQANATVSNAQPGYRKGVLRAGQVSQFNLPHLNWLDCKRESLRRGYGQKWDNTKIIMNAAGRGRGAWRIAAAIDTEGLLYSDQFYGLWPIDRLDKNDLLTIVAILNGPVANAFIALHSDLRRLTIKTVHKIPMPLKLPLTVAPLVEEYNALSTDDNLLVKDTYGLDDLLTRIDATVLEAYDLPPHLEAQLLTFFTNKVGRRPVCHPWKHWDEAHPGPGLRLSERLSGKFDDRGAWISETFEPLPDEEAELLREYGA